MLVNRCTAGVMRVPAVIRGMIVMLMIDRYVLGKADRCSRMMRGVALPRRHAAGGK